MNKKKLNKENRAEEGKAPTVEDLLRLKRYEHPEPESWESFQNAFRRRAMESVVTESVQSERWQRILLRWFAPAFGFGAVATIFLVFSGGNLMDHADAANSDIDVTSQEVETVIAKVSPEVAESRGGEFVDGALALSFGEDAGGVETGFLGKSLRYASEDIFEESALTLLVSETDGLVLPVTF